VINPMRAVKKQTIDAKSDHDLRLVLGGAAEPATQPFKLSVVVPVYNEAPTVQKVIESVVALGGDVPGHLEVLIVNDGSTDGTREVIDAVAPEGVIVLHQSVNRGKGSAVKAGLAASTGTHLLIFDADTEYDASDIPRLVKPLVAGRAEVVYGSRKAGFGTVHPTLIHAVGNRVMTFAANVLFGSAISDLHTCLKLIPIELARSFELQEDGFGLDTEISAELLRAGFRPFELPISYVGRSAEEGKKIRFSDAFRSIYVLVKVRLRGRVPYGQRDRSLLPRLTEH
jgi:glycosyltransferase involved in cell wall biosynthesis